MLPLGTVVAFGEKPFGGPILGEIEGYGNIHVGSSVEPVYLIRLSERDQFDDPTDTIRISTMCVHIDNVQEIAMGGQYES